MGITMAITKNDIFTTADSIAAEGGSPTLAAVRKVLGGGSFTTISEAMKEWKAQHQAQTATILIREAAPASVSERLNVFGSEIWAIALEMANARLQSEREALELVRQELEETQAEAIDLADQLTLEIEQAQATIQQQQDTLARQAEEALEMLAIYENEKVARQDAERKCEVTEAAMVEVRLQVTELKSEMKSLRSELSDTSKKLTQTETKLASTLDILEQTAAGKQGKTL
jgi:chromosome segregation ATPase